MKLIDDCKKWWKLWSIRINALGLLILGYIQFDPVGALGVWNMMPGPVQAYIPRGAITALGMTLFGLSMIARLVHQPKVSGSKPDGK